MFTHISWLLKSMKRFPSGVQKWIPFARAMGMGSTAAWADHSNIVCRRQSSIISSPVIASIVVDMMPDAIRAKGKVQRVERTSVCSHQEPQAVRVTGSNEVLDQNTKCHGL